MTPAIARWCIKLERELVAAQLTCLQTICDVQAIEGVGDDASSLQEDLRLIRQHLRVALNAVDLHARRASASLFDDLP